MGEGAGRFLGTVNILLGLGAGVTVCCVKINELWKLTYALSTYVLCSVKRQPKQTQKGPLTVFPSIPCAPPAPSLCGRG